MFSAIKSFAKRNRVLFILLIVAVSITLSIHNKHLANHNTKNHYNYIRLNEINQVVPQK